jgi:hypothetical protein
MKKIFQFLLLSSAYCVQLQAPLAKGDPNAATGETFSFDIGFAKFGYKAELTTARLWTASGDPAMSSYSDAVKPYGLSYTQQLASYVPSTIVPIAIPMANEEDATVYFFDGTKVNANSIANPIWGAQFLQFDVASEKPVFVIAADPGKVYAVQDLARYTTQTDTHKNITSLLLYDFGAGESVAALLASLQSFYVAHSVTPFGTDSSSKIALLERKMSGSMPYLSKLADTTISTSTAALTTGGAALANLGTNVTIASLFKFQQPYIGVDATAGVGGCAVALASARLTAITPAPTSEPLYDINFIQIAPTDVLNPGYDTIVSAASNNQVRITNITGMIASTNLNYLIVARDNGTGPQTIYALPRISSEHGGQNSGLIADFTKIQNTYKANPLLFNDRYFNTIISDPEQINPTGAFADQLTVGGIVPLDAPNSIKSLYSLGDCVYIVIGDAYNSTTQQPGTFKSQALFAQDGHIIGWTPWMRVLGSDQQMNYSIVSYDTISGFYVSSLDGTTFKSVYQTTFTTSSNLAPFLTTAQSAIGAVQGMFNFPQQTSGFNNAISLLISTGYNNVTIGQTGYESSGVFQAKPMGASDVISFSGDAINNHRSLIAAEIAHNGINHWIFVAGASGVSVLTNDLTGYTWINGLQNISSDPFDGETWKLVGDFSSVKKLVWDQTYLYVMTKTELYQIALDPNKFKATPTAALNATLITSSTNVSANSFFLDMIIDNGFCLIGTTNGLFSLNLPSGQATQINIPDGLNCASQLITSSQSYQPQREFKALSNLTVLNNSFGTQQARINRFVIQNSVVLPFDDFLAGYISSGVITGKPTSFVRFNDYMSSYFTDGTWNLACSYFQGINQPSNTQATPLVQQLIAGISAGTSSSSVIMGMASSYAPLTFLRGAINQTSLVRESTSGSLLINGNFASHANA